MPKTPCYLELIRRGLLKIALLTTLVVFTLNNSKGQVVPLTNAHAHNDYWHFKPLIQALNNGFMSVEADVHLLKGDLLVAHEKGFARKRKNLKRKYLQPLFEKAKANNFESVYPNGPREFILYIDIKSGCPDLLDTLIAQVSEYEKMLTTWENGKKNTKAVSIIVGACGLEDRWLGESKRYFYFDSHLDGIGSKYSADIIPRVCTNLKSVIDWRGKGNISVEEKEKIKSIIQKAHAENRKVRFWACTNKPKVWSTLLDLGVDWINVDRLKRFRRFTKKRNQ